jgi:hypothetical protein
MKNALAVALAFLMLLVIGAHFDPPPVLAQTGSPIYLHVATSLAGCAWPSGATVTDGMALCSVNQSGVLGLALAVNGGKFSMLTGAGGVAFTSEACTAFVRVGAGAKLTGCVEQ